MNAASALLVAAALSGAPAQPAPSLYSFADIYRMTVTGGEELASERLMLKVAAAEAPEPELHFSISAPLAPRPERERWVLLLSGLALAGWVAHRRLVHWL